MSKLAAELDRERIAGHLSTWIAVGESAGLGIGEVANAMGANTVIYPAHAGAAASVGPLLSDGCIEIRRQWQSGEDVPGDRNQPPERRLRENFRELLDEVAARVTALGYDIDDVDCERRVMLQGPGPSWVIAPLPYFETIDDIVKGARDNEACTLTGAVVRARVDFHKPALPPIATSSTIRGDGKPDSRIVQGTCRLLACLCEIDVPAGWRAEWEPYGDVVMTRV